MSLARRLTLLDATLIVVGGVIGSAIFITPADVAKQVPNPMLDLLLWVAAGLVALLAGFAFAELGAMYPEAGGQYVYIREAYGHFAGFIYGWVLFTAGNSAGLAAVAMGFALFLGKVIPPLSADTILYSHLVLPGITWHFTRGSLVAIGCIILLTLINMRGVKLAAILQNFTGLLTLACVGLMVVLGLTLGKGSWSHFTNVAPVGAWPPLSSIGVALVALFWTYDGWNLISWVAGEVNDGERNLPRAMIWGIVLVILTYVSANVVFIYALPAPLLAQQTALAQAAVSVLFSDNMGRLVSLLIAISCFGSMSIVILSGARVYYAMAKDSVFIPALKTLHPQWRTPIISLAAQCIWVCVITASGGYQQIYTCFIVVMTATYVFTVWAVFILRRTRPDAVRPYLCLGYPWLPALYLLIAVVFLVNTFVQRPVESSAGLLLALTGIPAYYFLGRHSETGGGGAG